LAEQVNAFDPALGEIRRIRPDRQRQATAPTLVVALAANSFGKINDSHVTVAAIIEMVHLATLVHDDVMDEAEFRRGKLTLGRTGGTKSPCCSATALFAHALKLAASFPTPEICRAVASATNTVCSGEILQTRHRRNFELSQKDYFRVLEMKTAELFALSCDMAAFLGNARPRNARRCGNLAWRSARRIRFTMIVWICSARKRMPANRSALIWPKAS
jgi:octaprenyl-diphosphate synthase